MMNKYCVVRTYEDGTRKRVSRFFNTEAQAQLRVQGKLDVVMNKVQCIELGIYTKPKRKIIQRHIDMAEVKGLGMDDKYDMMYANRENQKRYISFCIQNSYIVPKLTTVI